ncbi:MAG: hypothetical protein ACRDZO_26140 [Egibacteraceae bacterium]
MVSNARHAAMTPKLALVGMVASIRSAWSSIWAIAPAKQVSTNSMTSRSAPASSSATWWVHSALTEFGVAGVASNAVKWSPSRRTTP